MKKWFNSWQMGLMGGAMGMFQGIGQAQQQERALQGRLEAYRIRYGLMADERYRENTARMNAAMQKDQVGRMWTQKDPTTGTDMLMRRQKDPASGQWQDAVVGPAPTTAAGKSANVQAEISKREQMREDARQRLADAKEQTAERNKSIERDAKNRIDSNNATNKEYDAFLKADPQERAQLLAGVGDTGLDPKDPKNLSRYRTYLQQRNDKAHGVGVAPSAAAAQGDASASPQGGGVHTNAQGAQTDQFGRTLLKGKDGKLYIIGPDGKPVPTTVDASGNTGTPSALDDTSQQISAENFAEQSAPPEEVPDPSEDGSGGGLMDQGQQLADADPTQSAPSDEEEESDGSESEGSGLMATRGYA